MSVSVLVFNGSDVRAALFLSVTRLEHCSVCWAIAGPSSKISFIGLRGKLTLDHHRQVASGKVVASFELDEMGLCNGRRINTKIYDS